MKFLFAFIGFFLFTQAQAAGPTKIQCLSLSDHTTIQYLTLEGPSGFDLINPGRIGEIPLSINGSEPVTFKVREMPTIVGGVISYSYRNPRFISDITISITRDFHEPEPTVAATWTTDYPSTLHLSCDFVY